MSAPAPTHVTPAFQAGKSIQLLSKVTGKYLQRLEDGSIDANGEAGTPASAFIVHRSGATGVKIALQSVADKEKFVRQHGGTIDGHGNGGPACYFIVHKHEEDSTVSLQAREALESGSEDKFFLAVNAEGNPLLPSEAGPGPASRFHIEIVPEAKFHAPAAAGLSDGIHCRLENKASNKLLRLLPGGAVDAAGESGDASTLWVVHAVGKGLGKVSLQSESDPSKYLRLKEGVLDANGSKDPWSIFKVVNNEDGSVAFHAKTKKKDDESKFFVGFDADGTVSPPDLTSNDAYGAFLVSVAGHRHAGPAHK